MTNNQLPVDIYFTYLIKKIKAPYPSKESLHHDLVKTTNSATPTIVKDIITFIENNSENKEKITYLYNLLDQYGYFLLYNKHEYFYPLFSYKYLPNAIAKKHERLQLVPYLVQANYQISSAGWDNITKEINQQDPFLLLSKVAQDYKSEDKKFTELNTIIAQQKNITTKHLYDILCRFTQEEYCNVFWDFIENVKWPAAMFDIIIENMFNGDFELDLKMTDYDELPTPQGFLKRVKLTPSALNFIAKTELDTLLKPRYRKCLLQTPLFQEYLKKTNTQFINLTQSSIFPDTLLSGFSHLLKDKEVFMENSSIK